MSLKKENQANSTNLTLEKTSVWALVIILQTLISVGWLLLIPKEPGNAIFLGYSLRRLALLVPMAMPLFAGVFVWASARKEAKWIKQLFSEKNRSGTSSLLVLGGTLLGLAVWSFLFLFFILEFFPDPGAFYRLVPWLASYFLLGLELILIVPLFIHPKRSTVEDKQGKFPLIIFFIAFAVLIAAFIVIETTGLGKDPERVSIISLGVPILEGQIWYVIGLLALAITSVYAWHTIPAEARPALRKRGDLAIAAILWLAAVVLWMSLPLPSHNYFAPEAQAPNFEKYPFSDAEQYDYNSLNVYYGSLDDFVVSKPMYVSLLTIFHAIGGLNYTTIVLLQTLLVALFPSVLYLIGRELHSRLGGIAIALFAIFREVSSIQATSIANTSNTKLLLSDMPAALLASVLALTLIRWFKLKEKRINGHEFLVGGLIGFLILTRLQAMVLVPFVLLLVVIRYFPKVKSMVLSALILLAALALVISPVLIRNHSITGVYWVDNPASSSGLSRILTTGLETDDDFSPQLPDDPVAKNIQVFSNILDKFLGEYITSVSDNFLRNSMSSFLLFPVRLGNKTQFLNYLQMGEPFWAEVYSQPNFLNGFVIVANLALISLGFASVFKRNPRAVIVLLGLYVVYNLSSAVVRLSGWRFILPLEWVIYGFYAFGIVEVLGWLFRKIAGWHIRSSAPWFADYPETVTKHSRNWAWYAGFGLLFLFTGALIPIREHLLPTLLPEYSTQEVCERVDEALAESEFNELHEDFMAFCLSSNTRVIKGYGIYPRYFKTGEGFYDRDYDPWFGRQDYGRLVFRLIGTRNTKVYIKTDVENTRFPNGATVYLVGREKTKFEAQFVLVESTELELIVSSSLLEGKETLTSME